MTYSSLMQSSKRKYKQRAERKDKTTDEIDFEKNRQACTFRP